MEATRSRSDACSVAQEYCTVLHYTIPYHTIAPLRRAGFLEFISFIGIDQMLRGSGRAPGDYGALHPQRGTCATAVC